MPINIKDQRGFILIGAIVIVTLFTALALFGMSFLSSDSQIAVDSFGSSRAFYVADAGIQYALQNLSSVINWTAASDSTRSIANGSFSLVYSDKTWDSVILVSAGTVNNITRKIEVNMTHVPEFFGSGDAITAGGSIHTQGTTNFTINGNTSEGVSDLPAIDFAYFANATDNSTIGNHLFTAGVYNSSWFVDGNVDFDDNVRINGGIIATGSIDMKQDTNITVVASAGMPALACEGNFDFGKGTDITIVGFIYVGSDMTGNLLAEKADGINITGLLIVGGNLNMQNSVNVSISYDPSLSGIPGIPGAPRTTYWKETD